MCYLNKKESRWWKRKVIDWDLKFPVGYIVYRLWWWPFWPVVVVLACISLITSSVEYHYMCFLALSPSSLEKCLLKSTTHFYRVTFFILSFTNCLKRLWRKGTLLCSWWGCKLVQLLWITLWSFLKKKKKLTVELPYDPAIPLQGMYLEKNTIWKYTCTQCSLQHYLQ